MIELSQLLLYVAATVVLAITPGPGIFDVAARTLAGGRMEGVSSSVGTGIGGLVHVAAGAAGVSAIVLASAEVFTAMKFVGAAYLIWLGVRTIGQSLKSGFSSPLREEQPPNGMWKAFREGVLVESLNPKTAAFFLAFVPQFIDPSGEVALQFLILGTVSVALNTLVDIGVALAASRIRDGAASRPNLVRRLSAGSGAFMIALGLGLALARRPTN